MEYQECLGSLVRHGNSDQLIRLIAMFLTDRYMLVRVGSFWSTERLVHGGVPQGSILGVLLFYVTTDNLSDKENATGYAGPVEQEAVMTAGSDDDDNGSSLSGEETLTDAVSHSVGRGESFDFELSVTPIRRGGLRFVFLARNVRRSLGDRTVLRDQTLPAEPNPSTSAIWKHRPTSVHKYIVDSIQDTKLNYKTVTAQDGIKAKHAIDAQNVFKRTIRNAESIGMNTSKTNSLCISDSISYKAETFFQSEEGLTLKSGDNLKLLSFCFGPRPNCQANVDQ